jgi:hypothetical protein
MFDSLDAYLHSLNASLAYAPQYRLVQAVEECWAGLDTLEAHIANELTRILQHPRYSTFPEELRTKRADMQVHSLILYRFLALAPLYGTMVALLRAGASVEYVERGRRRVMETLDDIADLAALDKVRFFRIFLHPASLTSYLLL